MAIRKFVAVALLMLGILVSQNAIADEMFLKFSGDIVGDSRDPEHRNEIVLLSYSIDVTALVSFTGGGASVGKPKPGEFQFTASVNRSLPAILRHITTGTSAGSAILTLKQQGFDYARYTFETVFFTSVGQAQVGAAPAASAVSFVYRTLKLEIFVPGSATPASCVVWDVPSGDVSNCA